MKTAEANCEARISDSRACPLNSFAKIGHEFNIKPMSVSTFKVVLCTAGLSKAEPAFEKFPVSYGRVVE